MEGEPSIRPAVQTIFAALGLTNFVETVRRNGRIRFDVYGVELSRDQADVAGVRSLRWCVKFTVREADVTPVFVLSMHPAERWPVQSQHEVAKRRAR